MFSVPLVEGEIPSMLQSVALEDVTASLEDRARSWLDSNCSYCHQPGAVSTEFDMRYTTPFEAQNMVLTNVRDELGQVGTKVILPGAPELSAVYLRGEAVGPIAMPPLAKQLAELPAVRLLSAWIQRIKVSEPNEAPALTNPGTQVTTLGTPAVVDLVGLDPDDDLLYFDATNLPAGMLLDHESGRISGAPTTLGAVRITASASDGSEVSVQSFDWMVVEADGDGEPLPECNHP